MFTLAKLSVLLIAALSVAAMPSRIHMVRTTHNHREVVARVPQPEFAPAHQIAARDMPLPARRLTRKKRASNGRCKPKSSSSASSSTSDYSKPSPDPAPPANTPLSQDPPVTPEEDPKPVVLPTEHHDPTTTPTPTSTPIPTSTPPTPTPTTDPGNGGGPSYTGQGTYYSTGLGACGVTNVDSDYMAAVSHKFFDEYPGYGGANPNNNPMCGKTAKVTYGGKTIQVKLEDRCEGCDEFDLDFSPSAFSQLADQSLGRISGVQWEIID